MFAIKRRTGFFTLILVVASAMLLAATVNAGEPACRAKNFEFKRCGSAVERTCENRQTTPDYIKPGNTACVAGCFCKPGFVKNKLGRCVQPRACDRKPGTLPGRPARPVYPVCGPQERYESCVGAIEHVCHEENSPVSCCRPGCVPRVVPALPTCTPDEYLMDCKGAIEAVCDGSDSRISCCQPACWCKSGVRDSRTGICPPAARG
ncbi:hypothetical protein EC968_007099 [Mortierella alpina]|nr:hypothetical protein EC968_007099 [Mortierella alpina]